MDLRVIVPIIGGQLESWTKMKSCLRKASRAERGCAAAGKKRERKTFGKKNLDDRGKTNLRVLWC